ncbi:MAG: hypothetical protein CMJ51_07565 [Planctomycetaceae bacterium]|nr:hypothetical protein [Planctomycetaceae bacterium]
MGFEAVFSGLTGDRSRVVSADLADSVGRWEGGWSSECSVGMGGALSTAFEAQSRPQAGLETLGFRDVLRLSRFGSDDKSRMNQRLSMGR